MTGKTLPLVESPMHQQLILTMRTQYDALLSYLKSTCCHHKEQGDFKKVTGKTLPLVESPMHQQLILTMRTQYDARPNS